MCEHFDLRFAKTLHKYAEARCKRDIDFSVLLGAHKNAWLGPRFPCAFPNSTFSKRTAQNTNSKHLTSNRQHFFLWPPAKKQRYPSPSPKANPTGKRPDHFSSLLLGRGWCHQLERAAPGWGSPTQWSLSQVTELFYLWEQMQSGVTQPRWVGSTLLRCEDSEFI